MMFKVYKNSPKEYLTTLTQNNSTMLTYILFNYVELEQFNYVDIHII